MVPETLGYISLSTRRGVSKRRTKILLCLAMLAGVIIICRTIHKYDFSSSTLDNYQGINLYPMVHPNTEKTTPHQQAVVSSMYTDSYVFPLAVLGHTLKQHHVTARKILIYLPNRISKRTLCFVQAAGWELHPVERIPPPHRGKGIHYNFVDQYTKLGIWKLDQIGIKTAVYLDADTIVRRNFDEIWDLPFEFGGVPDIYLDARGFTPGINAGVLFFHPSTEIFNDMISKLETTKFRLYDAEQSYLNQYFGVQGVRLPYAYGGNLAIKERSPKVWEALQADLRIVHYTINKPFQFELKCPGGICDLEEVYDLKRQEKWLIKAKAKWKGHFDREITWWEESYNQMMKEIGDLCPKASFLI